MSPLDRERRIAEIVQQIEKQFVLLRMLVASPRAEPVAPRCKTDAELAAEAEAWVVRNGLRREDPWR